MRSFLLEPFPLREHWLIAGGSFFYLCCIDDAHALKTRYIRGIGRLLYNACDVIQFKTNYSDEISLMNNSGI